VHSGNIARGTPDSMGGTGLYQASTATRLAARSRWRRTSFQPRMPMTASQPSPSAPGSCGDIERWEVLRERWTETEWCGAPGGTEAWKVTEFHEFFGTEKKDTFKCQGESIRQPPFENGSTRSRNRCESSGSSALGTARFQGFVPVEVNGEEYEAAHIFSQSVVEGDTSGTTETEDWRRRSDGLLLRRQVSSDALTNAGGGARYIESYRIELIDPHPQR
jgi:hypothetical protein